tara:strand:+ start:148 stop:399 length:252 start_codon:yes stop_codon:yes gene_type:complete
MSLNSIKTTVEIKKIEIDIEVYYQAVRNGVWGDQPDSLDIEIETITRSDNLKPVSDRLREKILEIYQPTIETYIEESVYDNGC